MNHDTLNALSRMAAVVSVAALLVATWFVLTARGAADDSPASADVDRGSCLLGVDGASLRLNSVFLAELGSARVEVRPIAPARARGARNIGVPVRGASGVPCDADEGVIAMRGGLELVRGPTTLQLRKWRLAVEEGRLDADISQDNPVAISALKVDLGSAERIMIGGNLSLRANMLLGEGASAAINQAFGTRLRAGAPVARLALAVREVTERPPKPDSA